jgi:exopolyphosphatase/guanosine-5'-triphosphate,3'-diphosphate pyrophosphatase
MSQRMMLGAIDAGSNGLRVVVAELRPSDLIRVEVERVPVRLGHGAFTRGEIAQETLDQAVVAFAHFRELFDKHGVEVYRAVATSAVRNASNRDVLLHRLYHEAGIELEVIDGDEEARLVRKAVVHALANASPPRCILDLGGGSMEVNLREGAAWRGYSLPIGTVRLLESFGLTGAIGDAEAGMVRRYAATVMNTVLPARPLGIASAAACGGNADTLARMLGPTAASPPTFEIAALEQALPGILQADVEARIQRFGVRKDRAEVMGIAALVLVTVARQLGIQRVVAPGVGIREAVLIELSEAAREEKAKAEGAVDKALLTAARGFANRVAHDTTHGEQVRKLSRLLFQQLRDIHQLPPSLQVVLEIAALLHDVGEVVNTRGHHRHSEYMIRSGRIPGLDDQQRELIAILARCHRKTSGDARRVIADADLPKRQRTEVRRLSAILRLADSLDSEHRQRIEHIVCSRAGESLVIDLMVRDGPTREDAALLRKADQFREEFSLDVRVTVGRQRPQNKNGDGSPSS